MLEAIRPTTGGYVRAVIDGTNLYFYARADDGRQVNLVKSYANVNDCIIALEEIRQGVLRHGLVIYNYAQVVVIEESNS